MLRLTFLTLPLLVTVVFMFALRPLARGLGLIDRPGGRKNHVGEVPVIGGLAMLAGIGVGGILSPELVESYPYFLAAIVILVVVGAVDDRYELPASVRFLAQACAALIMIYGADLVAYDIGRVLFGGDIRLGWFAPIFTLLLVLTAINAFNLFDGSDGVAGVQALIALTFLGFAAIMGGVMHALPLIANLIGVVFGFLIFNWPSQRTHSVRAFMGDAGSTMLGFALAWVSVDLSQWPTRALTPMVVLWIFALPVFDLFSSMFRRVRAGRSPFHADSEHLHHVLKRLGLSSRRVAQVILLASVASAAFGVGGYLLGLGDGVLFVIWILGLAGYHLVFGSGLVIKRRAELRQEIEEIDETDSFELWRQRR
ncbi:MAG: MraY family glycosyltransferase [Steroidobacteraceae bacterium]